ncbi:MAG: hypothetical protein IJ584_04465 [Bacteroidales bacterium]|nr:hypothetical protein [Bacteroidales bacterium]
MKKHFNKIIASLSAVLFLLVFPSRTMKAQLATLDATNLAQAILSFIQDGDNMAMSSQQYISGMEVLKEQSMLLRQSEERYRKVSPTLYYTRDISSMAARYESMARMMISYAEALKRELSEGESLSGSELEYLIRRGSVILSSAVEEVSRAKEYLSPSASLSEAERREGLRESMLRVDELHCRLHREISSSLRRIDYSAILKNNLSSLEESMGL